ncbi:hypothetical protein C450_03542 [Halococcus salifodinae DSM 8989]|uniref:Uncharacterized protein n=1 Tax=Halococcus salifodinae DSM 8989 TaxID=1227456 RepID=M0NDE7_9EURY|nr:hypothetical protein C450_03542 [Halococcus salifodinae DSM 8989]
MNEGEFPGHWGWIGLEQSDLQTPEEMVWSDEEVLEPTQQLDGFENPQGIQIIQKKRRHRSASGSVLDQHWIDIVDAATADRELLFTTAEIDPRELNRLTREYMTLVDGLRRSD